MFDLDTLVVDYLFSCYGGCFSLDDALLIVEKVFFLFLLYNVYFTGQVKPLVIDFYCLILGY